jgi:heme-degrading monooxygenase HmoA
VVTIGMNYEVLAGKEEIFEAACKRVLEGMAAADGHDNSRIYRNIEAQPAEYLIVSRWSDETAFQAFISSDAFKKVTNWGRENILAGRPSHTTYREG